MDAEDRDIGQLVALVADALGLQIEVQIELVRAEFLRDTRAFVRKIAPIVLGIPLIGIGYIFACVGLVLTLAPLLGAAAATVLVGLLNLAGGLLLLRRSQRILEDSNVR